MKYTVKKDDEIVETKELLVNGEQNTVFIKEDEYGDTISVNPNGYNSHRPFHVLVNKLVLNFENGKLIISRKKDADTEEFLIQDLATGKIGWGADPHVQQFTSESTGTRRKIKGKNFKKGKFGYTPNSLKTERYEVPNLQSEHFMIKY